MSVEELISEFNALVGKRYWTSSHAVHDATLIDALNKRGMDVPAIFDGTSISFQHKIMPSDEINLLILA